ncbi:hypothetical protein BAME_04620 [Bacillus sp. M 2-6]|nr:hypothetical protein BAME_04620 [Bacillus sp. M 2-6]
MSFLRTEGSSFMKEASRWAGFLFCHVENVLQRIAVSLK